MCRSTITLFSVFVLFIAATFATGCADPTATTYVGAAQQPANGTGGGGTNPVVDTDVDQAGMPCTTAPADCSLRSAIAIANENTLIDVITFSDHLYIELTSPLPDISDEGVSITAAANQDVYVDARGLPNSVLRVTGAYTTVSGLRLFGSNGQPIISISGNAHSVTIRDNIIGDNDAPAGRCDGNNSTAGIHIDANSAMPEGVVSRVYIVANIIECNAGNGVNILTDGVYVGDISGEARDPSLENIIRWNGQNGVALNNTIGNWIRGNRLYNNQGEAIVGPHENHVYLNVFAAQ